jgi:hypothetical protein
MFGLSVSASAQRGTFTSIDPPGAGVASGYGSEGIAIAPNGAVTGFYVGSSNAFHAYVRTPDGKFTTFDAPGAGSSSQTPPYNGIATGTNPGTYAVSMDDSGVIAGYVIDANSVMHGYLRAPDGTMTMIDVPGAGKESGQGTLVGTISAGAVAGYHVDANNVMHGFVRAANGKITTFDAPDAGKGAGQGTTTYWAQCVNPAGTMVGSYMDANGAAHGYVRTADGKLTEIDAPGMGYGNGQGTLTWAINEEGAITGTFVDGNGVYHGLLREPDGRVIDFDVPGAGTAAGQGTQGNAINSSGLIIGFYTDAGGVNHGFARTRKGAITEFDVPGAGTGNGQGTFPMTNSTGHALTGFYLDHDGVFHGFMID